MTQPTRRTLGMAMAMAAGISLVVVWSGLGLVSGQVETITPALFSQLAYRYVGPPGNRVIAVVGVPGDPNVDYVGAASGGIWKTEDAGTTWRPIFDGQDVSSIGALAIAPSDPNVVWAGTGETFIRSNISIGDGIYKSTDAGRTWQHMGLEKTGRIGRIVIDPRNPDVVFAAALGHAYGPQPDRGVYRTQDGGKTWERVLFVDENTGASDLAMDPHNPRILFAGMWQIEIKTWGQTSGGPGSGLYMSRDGGTTWTHLTGRGLPSPPLGKIGVAVAPSDSSRVYALIETGDRGSLWRSDDGGEQWHLVSHNRILNERPHYYSRMAVSPTDKDEVYFPSNSMSITRDGGETADVVEWGGDNHDMWVDPANADRMLIGHDGGVLMSTTHGRTWRRVVLPIAQMYHVAVDDQIPYFLYGNKQDGPAYRGPSNSLEGRRIGSGQWRHVAGCESGFTVPDPTDNNIIWGDCFNGQLDVADLRTGHIRSVRVWPQSARGAAADDVKYRFNWTFPIAISPHDHNTVYVGSQYVHKTTNGGQSWSIISPDLSTQDPSKLGDSGGLTVDNLGVEYGEVVFAIAESPIQKGLIWAGTNDGLVHVTRDGGAHWTNVTANIPGLPTWGTISNVEPSRFDAGTCYLTVDGHQMNDRQPYVYKTTDYGRTWTSIASNLPRDVFGYTHCVREDPVRKGMLYLGTENAIYVSFDDGARWVPLQTNLPRAPVYWMTVQPRFNDLVVATYGRGFWILDDITPLRQLTDETLAREAYLFSPRQAYRFQKVMAEEAVPNDLSAGWNPPQGVPIDYYLRAGQSHDVVLTVTDAAGRLVRTLRGPARAGINRVWWDLRHEAPRQARLRTRPPGNPHVWDEKRFEAYRLKDWRPLVIRVINGGLQAPMAVPGTLHGEADRRGSRESTQSVTVLKDPKSAGSNADIASQVSAVLAVQRDFTTVGNMIDRIEWMRRQLEVFSEGGERPADVRALQRSLEQKLASDRRPPLPEGPGRRRSQVISGAEQTVQSADRTGRRHDVGRLQTDRFTDRGLRRAQAGARRRSAGARTTGRHRRSGLQPRPERARPGWAHDGGAVRRRAGAAVNRTSRQYTRILAIENPEESAHANA